MSEYTQFFEEQTPSEPKGLSHYFFIFRRRLTSILLVSIGLFILFIFIAIFWPPTYRSTATILIEEQDIPTEYVRSAITSYAAQRIEVIRTRVMTRANLLKIIDKFGLYADRRKIETTEEIVDHMRDDTNLAMISAEVIDPQSGRPTIATIAFTLAYEGENSDQVLKVANELSSLYLSENLKTRTLKAAQTSEFLSEEANRLNTEISQLENQLASFKEKHGERLPEFKQLNFQLLERAEQNLLNIETQLRSLEDRKFYLSGQLANINPASPMFSASGAPILDLDDRLKILKIEFLRLNTLYKPGHPDIVKIQREIESLEKNTTGSDDFTEQAKSLAALRTDLASKRERYKEEHPEITRLKMNIASLLNDLEGKQQQESIGQIFEDNPDNPAYLTLKAQLEAVKNDIASFRKQHDTQKRKIENLESRMMESPQVEREYLSLMRDYDNAVFKYREIKAKLMEAEISQELERERKGERFSMIDPPVLPEEPIKPNRLAIIFLGMLFAVGAGIGQSILRDGLEGCVHSIGDIKSLVKSPILTAIPYLENQEQLAFKKQRKLVLTWVAGGIFLLMIIMTHFFISPLDILPYRIERKIDQIFLF